MKSQPYLKVKVRSYMQRSVDRREIRQKFLIVCEGEKTEPLYFNHFRTTRLIIDARGFGMNTKSLVKEAIRIRNEKAAEGEMFNQTWCVFDKDIFPSDDFNDALRVAKKNGVRIAYSNEAFELWYLLHFCYCDTAITRQDYKDRLSQHMNHKYCKNSETIFDEIFERQKLAIQNAKRLLKTYNPSKPCDDNPSTTVHLLVEQLNRFSQ